MNLMMSAEMRAGAAKKPVDDGEPKAGHKMFGPFFTKVQHPAGSTRSGMGPDGEKWATVMHHDYGELPGSKGADGDPVDVYLGPNPKAKLVHVLHINKPDGSYSEDKAMIGFNSQKDAIKGYKKHYPPGVAPIGAITTHTIPGFRKKVRLSTKEGGQKLAARA